MSIQLPRNAVSRRTIALAFALVTALTLWLAVDRTPAHAQDRALPNTGLADPANLVRLFNRWRTGASPNVLTIPLVSFGGLSAEVFDATGQVRLDLRARTLTSRVAGLPEGEWELWLIDNRAATGSSTFSDSGDTMVRAGSYRQAENAWVLEAALAAQSMEFDRAMVVRAGRHPTAGFVLAGSAALFERWNQGYLPEAETEDGLWQLVARGRELFTKETFAGNGRSCGSCHAERNNFTLDAKFAATLPTSDPLFVHERNSELKVNFEDGLMLRGLGLILGNSDGGDDLTHKFTLRPPPSLQSIATQIQAPDPFFGVDFTASGRAANQPERLGWGNDNLPLHDFAIGAVAQHMTKALTRRAGTDFRLPTDEELDALAAYQLSIGRAEEFDLKTLKLRYSGAIEGQKLYLDTGAPAELGHKNCNSCHFNGGGTMAFGANPAAPGFSLILDANPRGFNGTIGTNVNGLPASLALRLPPDGGYGRVPLPFGGFGNFGNIPGVGIVPVQEFNSGSLVESADTAPFFHNHAVASLEEAVAFYGTDAYKGQGSIGNTVNGPVQVKISDKADDPEVLRIAAFLRVLNILENIRSSVSAVERGRRAAAIGDAKELASLAREEVLDALEVASQGLLAASPDFSVTIVQVRLIGARTWLEAARDASDRGAVDQALRNAVNLLRSARGVLVDESTLPESFRN